MRNSTPLPRVAQPARKLATSWSGKAGRVLALSALLLALPACYTDLTEVPKGSLAPENFYRNSADALAAVNAAYAAFSNLPSGATDGYTDNDYYGRHIWMLVEYPSEVMTLRLAVDNERTQPDIFNILPNHLYINTVWRAAYHAVNRANAVIDNVPRIDMDTALRGRIVAEARFLRALHYFNLVRLFGSVPLHLSETKSLADARQPQATTAQVYQAIIKDLTDAAAVLPAASKYTGADRGRASRGAAKALLGKVYLQYGALGGGGAAAYQGAETALRQVITDGGYTLLANYADVFYGAELNAEVIFDVQNTRVPGLGGYMCDQLVPRGTRFPYCDSQNPSFQAEWPFFYSYDPNDTRKAGSWLLTWTSLTGTVVTWDSTQAAVNLYGANGPTPRKWIDTGGGPDGAEEPNFILIRYADVLLSLAEAINEQAGPTGEAYGLVNQVRARAKVAALAPGLGKQAFKDSLFLQRRYEFPMELHGHFDSQRNWAWAKARIEASASAASAAFWNRSGTRNSGVPKRPLTLSDKDLYYPIPQPAIDANPALKQNPGY